MRRFYLILILLLAGLGIAHAQFNSGFLGSGKMRATPAAQIPPSVIGVGVSNSITPAYSSGSTSVGPISVQETGGTFGGTLTLGGTNASDFSLSSTTLPSTLNIASAAQTCSVQTTYNITITPTQAGVAGSGTAYAIQPTCNPSGGGLTAPAGAQAANFTTLALNMDFTGTTSSSYNGTTFNITNMNTSTGWLYCYGGGQYQNQSGSATNPTLSSAIWWLSPSWGNASPCSRVSFISDSGTQALDIQWQPTDLDSGGSSATEIDTWTVNESANMGHDFPLGGSYIEWRFREPQSSINSCPASAGACLIDDVWAWPSPNSPGAGIEWDFIETYANGAGFAACHPQDAGTCATPNSWPGFMDYTQYHTYAIRMTTDGTNMDECGYIDGTFQSCSGSFTAGTNDAKSRDYLRLQVGPAGASAPTVLTGNMDMYVQWERVWTCSSWTTTPCTGTVLNGAP